jgi:phosphoglycerate dehydrogenase-like enzyme
MKYHVFIVDSADLPHGEDDSIEREVLQDCASVALLAVHSEEEFRRCSSSADALILWHHLDVTAGMLAGLTKTRLIVRNGVGYDNVDIAAAGAAGIAVANVPDYGTEEVADHTIALILALFRQLKPTLANVAKGNWDWRSGLAARRIRGNVLGIVGCGRIGTAMALRAKALGFLVRFFDPYLPVGYEKGIGVQRVSTLDELVAEADVLSIHAPLTEETRHLIAAPQFEADETHRISCEHGARRSRVLPSLARRSLAGNHCRSWFGCT